MCSTYVLTNLTCTVAQHLLTNYFMNCMFILLIDQQRH